MLSERVTNILSKHTYAENALSETQALVKEVLAPYGENGAMTYRYEHTLRVAARGKQIAEGEGWQAEPLIMACLLHDVGYAECQEREDFRRHQYISAEIAEIFLKNIGYDRALSKSICRAVELHCVTDDIPEGATGFELSARDADDLDRFDILRLHRQIWTVINERSAAEIEESCKEQLKLIEDAYDRVCGTKTAEKLWKEQLAVRKQYYEALLNQMKIGRL